ncbi:MAG: hypothetical protein QXS05_05730 [Candidatus Bathyarchaeia archaeon]
MIDYLICLAEPSLYLEWGMGAALSMFEDWIEKNMAKISLYFRGKGANNLKLKCPLCGKPLHRRGFVGKFECKNPKCKLICVELKSGEVKFHVEPVINVKYDVNHFLRIEI